MKNQNLKQLNRMLMTQVMFRVHDVPLNYILKQHNKPPIMLLQDVAYQEPEQKTGTFLQNYSTA